MDRPVKPTIRPRPRPGVSRRGVRDAAWEAYRDRGSELGKAFLVVELGGLWLAAEWTSCLGFHGQRRRSQRFFGTNARCWGVVWDADADAEATRRVDSR